MRSLVIVLIFANLSEPKSIRRQLEFLPSTFSPIDDASEKPPAFQLPKIVPSLTSENADEQELPTAETDTVQSIIDVPALGQLLEFLIGNSSALNFNLKAGTEGEASQAEGISSLGISMESDVLTTGNVKMDRLLANLEKPTERSKAIWMALLHDLVSNGSVNDLLGNFIRESASQVKREDPLFQETDGQEHLEEQLPDQLGGPGSPLTQMEEFILEPHLGPAIMPFQLPKGFFVSFIPRRAFGVVNGVARPPHGHGSFYNHRPPGLVDVINPPAYGYNFNGYRRFDPDATIYDDYYYYDDEPVADEQQQQ